MSHVYNIGLPEDHTEYLHRAGRAGRIGSPVQGSYIENVATPSLAVQSSQVEIVVMSMALQQEDTAQEHQAFLLYHRAA